jgi:hypothetical protein
MNFCKRLRGLTGAVARAEAAIAAAVGNFDSAPNFEQAVRIFQPYALVWEEAETCHHWGLALISKGRAPTRDRKVRRGNRPL